MSLHDAVEAAAALNDGQLQHAYREAVARGLRNTGCRSGRERAYGTLRLLTFATLRLPDLALYAHFAHEWDREAESDVADDDGRDEAVLVRATVGDVAAGALRLSHRALETHGHDVGYEIAAFVERGTGHARHELRRPAEAFEVPVGIEQARRATIALTRATAACDGNPLLFCEQLTQGLGHLLAVYLIVREAGG